MSAIYLNGTKLTGADNASNVVAQDVLGLVEQAGDDTTVQALLDEIADRVADKLLTKTAASSLYLPQSVQNVVGCKNLLPNNASTQAINGVTFTVNSDGSITISGTASAETFLFLDSPKYRPYPVGDYICSQNIQTTGLCGLFIGEYSSADTSAFVENLVYLAFGHENKTCTVDYSGYNYLAPYIYMAQGTSISGTIKPMLRPASYKDSTYEPYAMTNRELTAVVEANGTAVVNNYVTTNQVYCRRCGMVKMVRPNITINSTASDDSWITFATLPKDFLSVAPYSVLNMFAIWGDNTGNGNAIQLTIGGDLQIRPKKTGTMFFTMTYI